MRGLLSLGSVIRVTKVRISVHKSDAGNPIHAYGNAVEVFAIGAVPKCI